MKKILAILLILILLAGCSYREPVINNSEETKDNETVHKQEDSQSDNSSEITQKENLFLQPTPETIPGYTGIVVYKDEFKTAPKAEEMQDFAEQHNVTVTDRNQTQPEISNISEFESNFHWMPTIDNETDIDILASTQVVEIEDAWYSERESVGYAMTCYDAYREFGSLTFLRTVDEYNAYTVYKVCGGGYLYVFFCNEELPYYNSYKMDYVPKAFTAEDIKKIQVGDSIDKVMEIDPSVERYKNLFDVYYCHTTTHVTSEGLFIIDYEKINGEIVVSAIELCEDSIYRRGLGDPDNPERFDPNTMVQMKLLPQDYPPAN